MDDPIKPRALVPAAHKPRMRYLPDQDGATQWRCSGLHACAYGPTMGTAFGLWLRRVRARAEALRLSDALERSETFGVPMSQGDRHAAARLLERSAGGPW